MSGYALDELDRRLVAALQLDGRASWTALAETCRTSVPTAARRVGSLIASGCLRVAILPHTLARGPVEHFSVQITCRPGMSQEVANALVAREDVRFVAVLSGQVDVFAEVVVPTASATAAPFIDEIQQIDGVERSWTDLVTFIHKASQDWLADMLGGHGSHGLDEQRMCEPSHLDTTDWALLDLLREDGRMSFSDLGAQVGVNESTVRRRIDRMLQCGCAYALTMVSAAAVGYRTETLMWVRVEPARLREVTEALCALRPVRYVASLLGNNELLCEVIAPTTADLHRFTLEQLAGLPGVLGWSGALELLTVKRGFVETPWSRTRSTPGTGPVAAEPV